MIFCLGEGKFKTSGEGYQKNYRIFNNDISKETYDTIYSKMPSVKLPIASWVYAKNMTKEEKENNSNYKSLDGYLKRLSYHDAFKEMWASITQEQKNWFITLPNFDVEIWTKITGMEDPRKKSLSGKKVKVVIDDESYSATLD